MKKVFLAAGILILTGFSLRSQNIEIPGKPIAEIYTDFHFDPARDTLLAAFAVEKAYLGYNFIIDKNFSATLLFNIGKPDELAVGSKARRYAYYREVSINYSAEKLNLSLGIINTRLFSYQQKFWGKRFLARPFQELNGYGTVADLGFIADYKINEMFDLDLSITNGEGYSNIQLDNKLKYAAGITITPSKQMAIRLYCDLMRQSGLYQTTLVGFTGFKNDYFNIGIEVNYKSNLDLTDGHNAWGISGTGGINLTKKIEFFTRYDYSTSVLLPGDAAKWNYQKDGSFIITGVQYTFNNYVKIALDYQGTFPVDASKSVSDLIFLNALFKF